MSEQAFPGDPLRIKAADWNQVRRQTKPKSNQVVTTSQWVPESYFGVVTTEITARSGMTLGSGQVELHTRNDSNELVTTDIVVDVYSAELESIAVDKIVTVAREWTRRDFYVIKAFEDTCDEKPITDIRVSGNTLQYEQCGDWVTWHTGTDCP